MSSKAEKNLAELVGELIKTLAPFAEAAFRTTTSVTKLLQDIISEKSREILLKAVDVQLESLRTIRGLIDKQIEILEGIRGEAEARREKVRVE